MNLVLSKDESGKPLSPFMVFPVDPVPYMKAAYRGGCDPYNSVTATEDALFNDIEIAEREANA